MTRQDLIEFAVIGGIAALCELFVLAWFLVALLVMGTVPWL